MVYKSKNSASAKRYAAVKQRIRKGQRRAKRIGFLYLIATLAIAALACLSLVQVNDGNSVHDMGVMSFYQVFMQLSSGYQGKEQALAIASIYALMLVIIVVCVCKEFSKVRWLCKKKASRTYGFNRPMYAMDDMARAFTWVFASVVVAHITIACLAQEATFSMFAYVVLGIGVVTRLLCGVATFEVGLFEIEDGFAQQQREHGKVSCVVRNVLQIAACALMGWGFYKSRALHSAIANMYVNWNAYLADPMKMLIPCLEIVAYLFWALMVLYAVSDIEYDIDGRVAYGRKRFFWLSFVAAACLGGALGYSYFALGEQPCMQMLVAGGAAIGVWLAEIILFTFPKEKQSKTVKVIIDEIDEKEYIKAAYSQPNLGPQVDAPVNIQILDD